MRTRRVEAEAAEQHAELADLRGHLAVVLELRGGLGQRKGVFHPQAAGLADQLRQKSCEAGHHQHGAQFILGHTRDGERRSAGRRRRGGRSRTSSDIWTMSTTTSAPAPSRSIRLYTTAGASPMTI